MWKRGGRSSALDRAQALLSVKRSSRGDAESVQGSTAATWEHKGAVGGYASNLRTLRSDLSDLSSVSSVLEHGAGTVGSAAAAAAGKTLGREGDSIQDVRPLSSLGGGGSTFLKKAQPPATNSSQSPVGGMQQVFEPRNVSSSLRGSQTAALSRLGQIESRIRSCNQAGQWPKSSDSLTSDLGMSPPPAAQSLETAVQLSVQSSSEQSLRGKHFLKYNTAVAVTNSNPAAAQAPRGSDFGLRSRSKAADAVVPSVGLETKVLRVMKGVSLESDEDMRKLLGDSLDSSDNSFLTPVKLSSGRTSDKMVSKSSQKVHSASPRAAVPPSPFSNTAASRFTAFPSRPSSPFQFMGQAEGHFGPSALSSSPSSPCVSPSPMGILNFPLQTGGSQHSLSSMSRYSEVLSLEQLFPVGSASEDPHSEMSAVSSEDFKINVMTLDDLLPANLGFTAETPGKERECKLSSPLPGFPNKPQLQRLKEKEKGDGEQQKEEEGDVLEYQSDFESESRTEPDYSANQVSEYLQGHGYGEEVVSEVREETSDTDVSCRRAENNYSSIFFDKSCSCSSWTSDHSQTLNRSTDSKSSRSSRSSVSPGSQNSSHQSRRHALTRRLLKEAAVQTQPDTWLTGMVLGPAVSIAYMDTTPVAAHALSAEMVEALITFNPAVFSLNEFLKQQLAMTRQLIEQSQHLHSSLLQSLEPPNHRYTTLEDTKEYICKHRPPKLVMKEALEEVLQEMRDNWY